MAKKSFTLLFLLLLLLLLLPVAALESIWRNCLFEPLSLVSMAQCEIEQSKANSSPFLVRYSTSERRNEDFFEIGMLLNKFVVLLLSLLNWCQHRNDQLVHLPSPFSNCGRVKPPFGDIYRLRRLLKEDYIGKYYPKNANATVEEAAKKAVSTHLVFMYLQQL